MAWTAAVLAKCLMTERQAACCPYALKLLVRNILTFLTPPSVFTTPYQTGLIFIIKSCPIL